MGPCWDGADAVVVDCLQVAYMVPYSTESQERPGDQAMAIVAQALVWR